MAKFCLSVNSRNYAIERFYGARIVSVTLFRPKADGTVLGNVTVNTLPESAFTKALEGVGVKPTPITTRNAHGKRRVYLVREVISVTIPQKLNTEWLVGGHLVVNIADSEEVKVYIHDGIGYVDAITGRNVEPVDVKGDVYRPFVTSPAGLRRRTITFVKEGVDYMALLDLMSGSSASRRFLGQIMSQEKAVKAFARLSQAQAPSSLLGHARCVAIYAGKFQDAGGNDFMDGFCLLRAEFVRECMFTKIGDHANKTNWAGWAAQIRGLGQMIKSFAIAVEDIVIKAIIHRFKDNYVRIFDADEIREFENELAAGGGKYAGKLVLVGGGLPDIIVDLNALKGVPDLNIAKEVRVLDVAKTSKAHTSIQLLRKLEITDEVKKHLIGKFMDKLEERFAYKTAPVVSTTDVGKSAPGFAKSDPVQMAATVEQAKKAVLNDGSRISVEVDGVNVRFVPDISPLFGGKTLMYGEIFSPYMSMAGVEEALVIKYPSIGTREGYIAKGVDRKTIEARIDAAGLQNITKKALKSFYKSLSGNVAVMPAVEELKKQLAGMDFDYDGGVLFFDPVIVESYKKRGASIVVNITPPAGTAKKAVFTTDFGELIHKQLSSTGGLTIGGVTNDCDTLLGISTLIPERAAEWLHKIFEPKGLKSYASPLKYAKGSIDGVELYTVDIDESLAREVVQRAKEAKLATAGEIKAVLRDLNVVYRFTQEVLIDSAKTGVVFDPGIDISTTARAGVQVEAGNYGKKTVICQLTRLRDELVNTALKSLEGRMAEAMPQSVFAALADTARGYGLFHSLQEAKSIYGLFAKLYRGEAKGENEDAAKETYKERCAYITDTLRSLYGSLPYEVVGAAVKAAAVTTYDGKQALDATGRFAERCLSEEYKYAVCKLFGSAKFVGHPITNFGYDDGAEVKFVDGIAENAIANDPEVSGTFVVKNLDGKWYAVNNIEEVLKREIETARENTKKRAVIKFIADNPKEAIDYAGKKVTVKYDGEYLQVKYANHKLIGKIKTKGGDVAKLFAGTFGIVKEAIVGEGKSVVFLIDCDEEA